MLHTKKNNEKLLIILMKNNDLEPSLEKLFLEILYISKCIIYWDNNHDKILLINECLIKRILWHPYIE